MNQTPNQPTKPVHQAPDAGSIKPVTFPRQGRKEIVPLGRLPELAKREDASLLLLKPQRAGWDYEVIHFASRLALESFNKKAGLKPVVYTQVPRNCVIYAHQSDSEARTNLSR